LGILKKQKGYKLYDAHARKFIISCDVQFVENEAWDGMIARTLKSIEAMEHGDTEYEVVQTSHSTNGQFISWM
jgi:hypothetical protein